MKESLKHFSRSLFFVVSLSALVGCNGAIDSFEFVDRRGAEAAAVGLRDPDRLPAEEEALVRGTPRTLAFRNALEISEDEVGIYLRYEGGGSGEVRVGYEEGEELSWVAFPLPGLAGVQLPVRFYAPLPRGAFSQIEIDPGEGAVRIRELGLSPYRPGIELDGGGVQVSLGYDLTAQNRSLYLSAPEPPGSRGALFELAIEVPWDGVTTPEEQPRARMGLVQEAPVSDGNLQRGSITSNSSEEIGFIPAVSYELLPGRRRYHLHPGPGESQRSTVALSAGEQSRFRAFRAVTVAEDEPIPADMGTILAYPRERWRQSEYELFSWSAYPRILVIDTMSYEFQSRLFKRLAFFVEKEGFRGRLLSDGALEGRHGWNAHNYRPEGLAEFFNAAAAEEFPLSEEELFLRELLLEQGLLLASESGAPYEPGSGGLLSVSQESYPLLRELLLTHEAMHGIFYEEEGFRRRVRQLWEEELSEEEREFWRFFLSYMSYDPEDDYLMQNEMQAYLLQYPEGTTPGYFRYRIAERLRAGVPHQRSYIDTFLGNNGDTFRSSAEALNDYLFRETGFRGGDVLLVEAGGQTP